MIELPLVSRCRLSGEPLLEAPALFELADVPLPGIYPATESESLPLRSVLRVVQAPRSGLVQLAHRLDPSVYERYAFAGGTSPGYGKYLDGFAQRVLASVGKQGRVLEVGCGDGALLDRLNSLGVQDTVGIDPSLAARAQAQHPLRFRGYFPDGLPAEQRQRPFHLIILRHVLEHIEEPGAFVQQFPDCLVPGGELWIEVPDLESTVRRGWWSNFYQLHCNYFELPTLDALLEPAGFGGYEAEVVDIFGGSLLRRYRLGWTATVGTPNRWTNVTEDVAKFRRQLSQLASLMPQPCAGYGAAERTAVTLGFCPALAETVRQFYDGNPLLAGRFIAGTSLPIATREALYGNPPSSILLFALSHKNEIVADFRKHLPGSTLVGIVGDDFACRRLATWT